MRAEINVSANMLTWAIDRAGYELQEFAEKMPKVIGWINGKKNLQ